jgi:hypothetical protein
MCWLRATIVSGWGWGTYLIHGVSLLPRRLWVLLYHYWLLLFGGLTLLLAICIQYVLPQWSVYGIQFLQENLLVVGTVVLLLLFLFVWKVPKWQVAHITDEKDRLTTESGFRQTLVQLVGGAALLGGLYFTAQTLRTSQETLRVNQKTLETTQQGQITERFTKAVEQLGNKEQLTIRLGGIYALEQVAKDSDSHYWAVMEVLTAFVREQAPVTALPPDKTSGERETKERPHERKLPSDLNVAPTEPWSPVSRIKSGCHRIRRLREPGAVHPYNVAPRQSGSTAGGHDVSLGWRGVAGVDAVCRQDTCRPPPLLVATWRAKCRRNTPSGHEISLSQIHSWQHPQSPTAA